MSVDDQDVKPESGDASPVPSSLSAGVLARQNTPNSGEIVAVAKVCPQCGVEYLTSDRFCPRDGSPLRPKAGDDPLIGRVIADRYLVLAKLGEGGMGRVYLGEHVKMNRQCAIKVMNQSLMNDAESLKRFSREASNAARILHPNVAAVFDYGEADKIVYLVMEFVDGEPLSAILEREGALEPRRAVDLARQIADGLGAAHELGIAHRDLKPDNVIVARSRNQREVPKIVDFGIAKALTALEEEGLTRSGLVIGTPEYMSPEQLLGDPIDARTDVYSLGCILYQMLTGIQAFAGDTREQMIRRRLHETPPHVSEVIPGIPRPLDALIVNMLARSASERLANGTEVRDALDPSVVLEGWDQAPKTGPRVRPNLQPTRAGFAAHPALAPTARMPQQGLPAAPAKKRSRLPWLMVLVALAGLGGLGYWGRGRFDFGTVTLGDSTATKRDTTPVVTDSSANAAAKTLPRLDSASFLRKKAADSVAAEVAKADSAIHAPLERYARAFTSVNLEGIIQAYPTMPDASRNGLRRMLENATRVRATPKYGPSTVNGDRAELDFRVLLRITSQGSVQPSAAELRYRAVLARQNGAWQISSLISQP